MTRFGCARLACLIGITIVLLGCGKSYRLRGQGSTAILMPPVLPATLTGSSQAYRIAVSKARSRPANLDGCDVHNELVELRWRGNTAEIRVKPDSYFPAPGDERPEEIAPRVYLDSVQSLEAFRRDLQDRVVSGCLESRESQRLTRTISERFPLPPMISSFIRFGGGFGGFVDLTPDFRLKVVTPVHSPDNRQDVIGYRTAWYRITSAPTGARVRVSFDSATPAPAAPTQLLEFPASFRFYRLVFRTAVSSSNHLAAILSAADEAALDEATRRFEAERDPSCEALSLSRATCMAPAGVVAVNLEFPVWVNGRQVFVPLGGTLSNALDTGKRTSEIPVTLRMRRSFRGRLRAVKFDLATQNMRGFVLMPGDRITW